MTEASLIAADLRRQIAHWLASARTFRDAEEFASLEAWRSVERETGAPLRQRIDVIVKELIGLGEATAALVERACADPSLLARASSAVQSFRHRYGQVDTTLDFLGDVPGLAKFDAASVLAALRGKPTATITVSPGRRR